MTPSNCYAPYHHSLDNQAYPHPLGKIVCVGRNYADHAKELNNPVPTEPMLFIKPATAAVPMGGAFAIPAEQGSCHFETEMAVLIGAPLSQANESEAEQAIAGVGLAYDLTLREVQEKLKAKGHPWERAKSFDASCPLSGFVTADQVSDWQNVQIRMSRNGSEQQNGNSGDMITGVLPLLSFISRYFTLQPGDVVLTGTPAGVGPLESGDQLDAELVGLMQVSSQVY